MSDFRLLMISAMYENGGNVTHRLLDGHRQLLVYPFESQLGTPLVSDALSGLFPARYRWPTFDLSAAPGDDFHSIIDEECKVRARTPDVSKFRGCRFDLDDDERRAIYERLVAASGRTRATAVEAFFRATFEAWRGRTGSGQETVHVGYSPIVVVDAEAILSDLPGGHVLHVVRNPWSAYADTKRRPVPLPLAGYMLRWSFVQSQADLFARIAPDRVHIVRFEDVVADPVATLGPILGRLGVEAAPSLAAMSFDGRPLAEGRPWGTIARATPEANRATAAELTGAERDAIALRAGPWLERFGYAADALFGPR